MSDKFTSVLLRTLTGVLALLTALISIVTPRGFVAKRRGVAHIVVILLIIIIILLVLILLTI